MVAAFGVDANRKLSAPPPPVAVSLPAPPSMTLAPLLPMSLLARPLPVALIAAEPVSVRFSIVPLA